MQITGSFNSVPYVRSVNFILRYGDVDGVIKYNQNCLKYVESSTGERNPMYGKPSPYKTGNGISGYYKENY